MVPLLTYLREAGVVPAQNPTLSPLGELLGQYRMWMVQERGLAAMTVLRYENTARRFLQEQATDDEGMFEPAALAGADINAFLLRECGRVSAGSAKGRVAELRSVLRFLYLQGITPLRLGTAVPPVGGWRFATLPPHSMTAAGVQRLLDSVERSSDVGVRDFAIMMLVARLGLRSIEIARLELGDVDWRAGELMVRGKGRRQDRLPLPAEVGEAVVAYLSCGRSPAGARQLFLTCRAPRGPIRADLVGDVVERACLRAGLPHVGPISCGTPSPVSSCVKVPACWRSVRSFAIRTWPPPPSTPRSTSPRCATSPSPGQEHSDEPAGAGPRGLPATAPLPRPRAGRSWAAVAKLRCLPPGP